MPEGIEQEAFAFSMIVLLRIANSIGALHLRQVAYVDIDAHHGDGVFYGFEDEPRVLIGDIHEDGRFLYPGSGSSSESGKGLSYRYKAQHSS